MLKSELLNTNEFLDNIYLEKYINLIEKRKLTTLNDCWYTNNHHIIPNHLKISNETVKLKISEHLLAHYYLYKASGTERERIANLNAINIIYGNINNIDDVELVNISEDVFITKALARDILKENIKSINSLKNKGKIYINKNGKAKKIYPEDLPLWEAEGWIKGGLPFSEEHKKKLRIKKPMSAEAKARLKGRNKGSINVIKDNIVKRISLSELDLFLADGWVKGSKPRSKEAREKTSKALKGRKHTAAQKKHLSELYSGYVTMTDGIKEKHVYKQNVEEMLSKGWWIGRSEKFKQKLKKYREGKN